ncbi:MAG: conjugal transfer protein TraG N-terminal domain-containing protein [Gammaproteobacteria bacterium]|nr:conjugal transfer protein TraG N-terminal domain-containing protein [Gammaproteobacteria bacterium]MDH5651264.1 conjugal transfer protein TraG N-terminal domain-containing protein [Gammaproteobacteria bacterium]
MSSWEIFTYGGGATLLQLFNGLVAIMGDSNYLALLKITSLITVIWVIIEAIFMRRPISIQPFIIVILIFYILFIPRVNVIITDRVNPANSGVVANVPIGVGFTASMASNVGDWMARTFEGILTLPNDLQYASNGLLFGSNLIRASSQFEITDSRLAGNISEFMQQCVFYDILTGFYTWNQIVNEPDLWNMLRSSANPARSFQYQEASGTKVIITCPAGAQRLNTDWTAEITRARQIYGNRLFPGDPLAEAKFMAVLPVSFAYMSNITTTAADSIRQNMMANAVKRSLTRFAARADAGAAAQDLALAQAEAQRRTSYSVLGELAGKTLPLLRNVFEVLVYGMFPLFLILMFTPASGKALMFYLKSMFWLQLWSPLYAILNLIMISYAAQSGIAVATLPGGNQELTLATATALGAVNADIASIASYLAWMIPLISWGVVNAGAGMSMSMLASGLGAITQQAGSSAAANVSQGNVNMGNMGLYGQSGFKNDFAPVHAGGIGTMVDGQGTTQTMMPTGATAYGFQQSNLGFSTQITSALRSSVNTQLNHAKESALQDTAAYGRSLAANYNEIKRFVDQTSTGTGTSHDFTMQDGTSVQQEMGELTSIVNDFAKKYGVSNDQAIAVLGTAGLSGKISLSESEALKLSGELRGNFSNADKLQKAWSEAQKLNESTNFSERYQNVTQAVQSEAAQISANESDSYAAEVSAGLVKQQQHREDTQASLREVDQWQQAQARVDDHGFSFQSDIGMAVRQFMIDEEHRSPAEVDNIIHRHNMGDTRATATISESVSRYAEAHGKDLAGVQPAPTTSAVTENSDIRIKEIGRQSSKVMVRGQSDMDRVQREADQAGVPDNQDIRNNAASVMDESGNHMDTTNSKIDRGNHILSNENKRLKDTVHDKQRIYSNFKAPSMLESLDKAKKILMNKFRE